MSKQDLCLRAYQSRNLEATQSYLRLFMIYFYLLTNTIIENLPEKAKRIIDKNLYHFSLLNFREHLRRVTLIDSVEYCLLKNNTKSNDLIINEIKNMLLAA
jgi:hypothetical protein